MSLAEAIAGYARRVHGTIGPVHHVASPLGAWLVLALAARTASGPVRADLAPILGMDPEEAVRFATDLLADPHPLVRAAASAWRGPAGRTDRVAAWLRGLPAPVATGDVDRQDTLDRWAAEQTDGLIDRFPVTIDRATMVVLASALATRINWRTAFETATADNLGPHREWRVPEVLRAKRDVAGGHDAAIARTADAGDVAVHVADAETGDVDAKGADAKGADAKGAGARAEGAGLRVVSVAAAPQVPADTALDVAHRIAATVGQGKPIPDTRSLFDLPLGEAPLWILHEERMPSGRQEKHEVYLPAWTARSDHDLAPPELGLSQAGHELGVMLGEPRPAVQARQVAMARFGRRGFAAAAVSAVMVSRTAVTERTGKRRIARLLFAHPYAVVAVATGPGPWAGLPVFSAWVAEADPDVEAGI